MTRLNSPRRLFRQALLLALLGCCGWALAATLAAPLVFETPVVEAGWQVQSSVFECRLSHTIEQYGSANFARRAGEDPRFYLLQSNRMLEPGEAELLAVNPLWRTPSRLDPLGRVSVTAGDYPVQLGWQDSQQLVAELQRGRQLLIVGRAWHQQQAEVRLVLAPVAFRSAYTAYQQCQRGLLPVNYEQVARTAVYFPLGSDELSEQETRRLDDLVRYVLADSAITAIFVDGHTDSVGLRAVNLEVSRQRAEMVSQYLVDRGVPATRITTRWHGERYPVASNREASGRAQNRRVTIRIDRLDDPLPPVAQSAQ